MAPYGYILCMFVLGIGGCRQDVDPVRVRVVDLVSEFNDADRRPPLEYQIVDHALDGVAHPSIIVPVPSRVTWALPLPRRGIFHAFVAQCDTPSAISPAPIRLRVGVSDDRIYEGLADVTLTPNSRGWIDLRTDLSAYAGWKWSLFYRPERIIWRVVLAADAIGGVPTRAVWGSPEIVTDAQAARQYAERRRQAR